MVFIFENIRVSIHDTNGKTDKNVLQNRNRIQHIYIVSESSEMFRNIHNFYD